MQRTVRITAAAAFVLAAGTHIAQSAAGSSESFGLAGTVAPSHPSVIKADIMTEVGLAAARGDNPPASALAILEQLAQIQPLGPEPFLVHGAIAFRAGETDRAEALLVEARKRAPRGAAARYLLADLYLRTGRPLPAMVEMSVLHRLLPDASGQLAPALAAYASIPGAVRQLEAILRAYPELEPSLLEELAGDPGNAELVMRLADRTPKGAPGQWRERLVRGMLDRGDHARAHQLWERVSGVRVPSGALFNPSFDASNAPPPFNWTLARDSGGVAEARSGGLQLLYYGREDIDLAAQVLLLEPGSYRLAMVVSGDVGEPRSLRWMVGCLGGDQLLLDLPLPGGTGNRPAAGSFTVPAGCTAQRLQLRAEGTEFPKEADARISGLRLERAGRQ